MPATSPCIKIRIRRNGFSLKGLVWELTGQALTQDGLFRKEKEEPITSFSLRILRHSALDGEKMSKKIPESQRPGYFDLSKSKTETAELE